MPAGVRSSSRRSDDKRNAPWTKRSANGSVSVGVSTVTAGLKAAVRRIAGHRIGSERVRPEPRTPGTCQCAIEFTAASFTVGVRWRRRVRAGKAPRNQPRIPSQTGVSQLAVCHRQGCVCRVSRGIRRRKENSLPRGLSERVCPGGMHPSLAGRRGGCSCRDVSILLPAPRTESRSPWIRSGGACGFDGPTGPLGRRHGLTPPGDGAGRGLATKTPVRSRRPGATRAGNRLNVRLTAMASGLAVPMNAPRPGVVCPV